VFSAAVHGFFAGGRRIECYVNGIPASAPVGLLMTCTPLPTTVNKWVSVE